ncbi:MAG TPA: C25 family cysteine peptidase [Candidatus Krumholzibacteria bacterium]|nr:C25 family cysteine peptidase [Candidatus Krumholzibacteria bacterium]HPD71441.1 C25 family cysteine peptidase [Candidatus Krumholzibacteria bacterium]HRY41626.1 C25 family cysteine peptidase [Candidatus Krumholzibacteria bacterium]
MTRRPDHPSFAALLLVFPLLLAPAGAAAALLSGPADAVLGRPVRTVLAADAGRTVVQFTFPVAEAPDDWQAVRKVEWTEIASEMWNPVDERVEPVVPVYDFQVAVPGRETPVWRVAAVQWHREPSDPGAPVATLAAPQVYRGVPLATVSVNVEAGGGILAGIVVEVTHPAPSDLARAKADAGLLRRAGREPVPGSVVNADHFRDLRALSLARPRPADKAPLPDFFALTGHWVRLEVTEIGIYALSGQQLEAMGVSLAQVDPAKMRLYKGGGLTLAEDPEISDDAQADRVGLTELAIAVDDGGDGEFDGGDRLLFYGFGTDVWLDRLAPTDDKLAFYNHPQEPRGVYWLTWEDVATPSPLPGAPRRVATVAAAPTGGALVTTHRARLHAEYNYAYQGGYVRDNWVWQSLINSSFSPTVQVPAAVPDAPADWQVDLCGLRNQQSDHPAQFEATCWVNDDLANQVSRAWAITAQLGQEQFRFAGTTTSLTSGTNAVHLVHDNYTEVQHYLAFDSFDLLYRATCVKADYPGALACVLWGDEVTVPGEPVDVRFTVPASGDLTVWDVSRPDSVVALAGELVGGPPRTLTVGLARDPGVSRHLVLFAAGDALAVAAGRVQPVTPLRQTVEACDYLVIHPAEFTVAAAQLAAMRGRSLPGIESPRAATVSVEDIFANFSGGQKDWRGIRQFLRWTWLEHGQRLRWVCLLGDASRDTRNYQDHNPQSELVDWIPTNQLTDFPNSIPHPLLATYPYVADESLVALDTPAAAPVPWDIPDLAVGRLPATSLASALALVDRTIAYVEDTPAGAWRNRMVYCADDLRQNPSNPPSGVEASHMIEAENLANRYTPLSVDLVKVYLEDFPYVGLYKPEARRALLEQLDAGATVFYYVGHGAASVLADEQVFLSDFIPELTNGERRFFFLAFSCDVGVFDDPASQSMSELFLLAAQGGGIGSIAASWVSQIGPNNQLSDSFWSALFPDVHVSATATLGEALIAAKAANWQSISTVRNSMRYNVLGDPAIALPLPVDDLRFAAASADSLLTGRVHEVVIDLAGTAVEPGADTTYELRVEEAGVLVNFYQNQVWLRLGNPAFRGNGGVPDDPLLVPFLGPIRMRTGVSGRIRCIVGDAEGEHVAVSRVPAVQVAGDPGGDVAGPDIRLGFAGGRTRVRPGDSLTAALYDTSGVNILASNPANSVLLEFDRSGVYTNVTDDVDFAPGSYTRANLVTTLPGDLAFGAHSVVMTASDMFGNVGADTLSFELEATSLTGIRNATVFPNPTPGPCRLICEVSGPMDLRWDIYTVSGRRVRSVPVIAAAAGPIILEWDGRDTEGDEIANGVYLYVLRGDLDADDHQIRETGQLVIMR